MRYAIQAGIVFDSSEPEYLLIAYGEDGYGRLLGQFHKIEDAFIHLHERNSLNGSEKRNLIMAPGA
jgi:hypothetical protein